jgi:hypothetical protein
VATPPVDLEYVEVLQPDHLPADTLRIVVFGPGQGEAVVVMLPEGGVGVVDGCREPERGNSEGRGDPVRELLNAIPTLQASDARLDFVCLTHPHSDHFGGLGHLLHRWGRRTHRLWMVEPLGLRWSNAWEQWLSVHVDGREPGGDNPLKRMLEEVQDLLTAGAIKLEDLGGGKRVLKRSEGGADLEIWSCAPSSNDLHHVRQAFIVASRGGNGSHVDPNQTSAALLLRWGEAQVLLGGDLLVGSSPNSGWNAARENVGSKPVHVVKVAHHASEPAHHHELWASMNPDLAIVTPFKRAVQSQPPRPGDIQRLLGCSGRVAITSPPQWVGAAGVPRRTGASSRLLASASTRLPTATPVPGARDIYNAVGVALDSSGHIKKLVLAGAADLYV